MQSRRVLLWKELEQLLVYDGIQSCVQARDENLPYFGRNVVSHRFTWKSNRNSVVVITVCKQLQWLFNEDFIWDDAYDVALNLFHKEKPQDCTGGECMLKIDWNVKESTYVSYLLFWSFSHIHSSMDLRPTSLIVCTKKTGSFLQIFPFFLVYLHLHIFYAC